MYCCTCICVCALIIGVVWVVRATHLCAHDGPALTSAVVALHCAAVVFEKKRGDEAPVDYTKHIADRGLKFRDMPTRAREELLATKRTAAATAPTLPAVPLSVELEKQVLLFNAYFQEAVHESPLETFRVRRVDILLYLTVGPRLAVPRARSLTHPCALHSRAATCTHARSISLRRAVFIAPSRSAACPP